MSSKPRVTIRLDIEHVSEGFTFLGKAATKAAVQAVNEHLELVGTESQKQVPRITGKLSRSMRKILHERPVVYGTLDYLAQYAVQVHEVQRPPSSTGKWKYLEDPFKAAEPLFRPRLADAVAQAIEQASGPRSLAIFKRGAP